ncbi:MAG: penicillin-insensitive murein endopeptidase [Bacteroidales bacterium]
MATWPVWGGTLPPAATTLPALKAAVLPAAGARDNPASLLALADDELARRVEQSAASLGSLSIGSPGGARLFNGVQLPPKPRWEFARTAELWGTSETMAFIEIAIDTVYELFADTPPIIIGDISGENGGKLKRHESHQGGRDVDFGFYYRPGKGAWFAPGTASNLDLDRNWALVRALIVRTDLEKIFLDTRIQRLLYKHALSLGEEKDWLDHVFGFVGRYADPIIQHVPGHRTHYHVRFYNAVAQELGRRVHPLLVQLNLIEPPTFTTRHVVRSGQTIGQIAARYGTSTAAIMRANGLRTTRLRAGRSYRIPVRAAVPPSEPFVLPARLLPTYTPPAMAAVDWPMPEPPHHAPGL